jgi:hypothetical protein
MSEAGPDDTPRAAGEEAILDQQEALLRQALGSELEYLVDIVQAGMAAEDFRRSPNGRVLLARLEKQCVSALAVLRDPSYAEKPTLEAAYQLRVAYAAMDAIASAVVAGKGAEKSIDQIS